MLIKSYFDESYNDGLLCVAGYSFTSGKARALNDEWKKMLARYKRLPYFRMSACNTNQDPFDKLTESECNAVATEAIGLIRNYAQFGYAATVDQRAFNKIVTRKGFVSTPYEFCSWMCLTAAKVNLDKIFPQENMSFFFEAGFQHQGSANKMMSQIFRTPQLRNYYRYKSHTFVDKTACHPVQAADLLAWQWFKDFTRRANGKSEYRGDLKALLQGIPHFAIHSDANQLQELVDLINAKAGTPIGNEIAGIALSNPSHRLFPKRPGEAGGLAAYEKMKKDYPERF